MHTHIQNVEKRTEVVFEETKKKLIAKAEQLSKAIVKSNKTGIEQLIENTEAMKKSLESIPHALIDITNQVLKDYKAELLKDFEKEQVSSQIDKLKNHLVSEIQSIVKSQAVSDFKK